MAAAITTTNNPTTTPMIRLVHFPNFNFIGWIKFDNTTKETIQWV